MNVPGEDADSTVRFEIAADGKGGSRFTLIQSGITDKMVEMGRHGWGSTLARLGEADGCYGRRRSQIAACRYPLQADC